MPFYCIYLTEGLVELHDLEQEYTAIAQQGRLISTQKEYQSARETVIAFAQEKQLPWVDRTQATAVMRKTAAS